MKIKLLLFLMGIGLLGHAQETFPLNGLSDKRSNKYHFINATIHSEPGKIIENGSFVIEEREIKLVATANFLVKNAVVVDLKGKHVYPGFLDLNSSYAMPEVKRPAGFNYYTTKFDSNKEGPFAWNEAVKAEVNAAELVKIKEKDAESLRSMGFTSMLVNTSDGIVRGTGALLTTGTDAAQNIILNPKVSRHFSFNKGSSAQSYPVSLMGAVALLRQTYLDADWYEKGGSSLETNLSLESFNASKKLLAFFHSTDYLDVLRADNVGDEFKEQYIFMGNGDEYKRLEDMYGTKGRFVLPINFPKPMDLSDPLEAKEVDLGTLRHWNLAPSNPAELAKKGISFTITSSGSGKDFFKNLHKAVAAGLSKDVALAALTTTPAEWIGMKDKLGVIKPGAFASFFVTDKEIFESDFKIFETWVTGSRYILKDINEPTYASNYKAIIDGKNYLLSQKAGKWGMINEDSSKVKAEVNFSGNYLSINAALKDSVKLSFFNGFMNPDSSFSGTGTHPDLSKFEWKAEVESYSTKKDRDKKEEGMAKIAQKTYPFGAYGNVELPKSQNYLIKNATVWTNEEEGIVANLDVKVSGGKIQQVGKNLTASADYQLIDGTGKHLTTGIIDEHSHIALFSINEIQTVSAHVRQTDVIDSEDVDIFRQLAGGVTTSQLLHGSADCIGGQSAIIKLKWGENAQNLQIKGADRFIKFALGENVKRGNSGITPNRYPITRMGVEQVYLDAFSQAKDYKKAWAEFASKRNAIPPRRDLALDALADILDNKLFITCHSYVQSEINMLMHVADSMGFRVNTFTHILEGYKVADKMKEHGVYGSSFSDWWSYKMEVKEAIPYNAAIMTKVGVVSAINSDDAEMARRLNQEAAKTMLYGGLTEEEAWKTVTLNPAKMLHLDKRLGSIKAGKDADLVLWNANPLSVYASPDFTMIEGAIYFDREKYVEKSKRDAEEKNTLIQAMLSSSEKKEKPYKTNMPRNNGEHIHCDAILEFGGIGVADWEEQFINK